MSLSTRLGGVLVAVVLGGASAGTAATIEIDPFGREAADAARSAKTAFHAAHAGNLRIETFDGHRTWDGSWGSTDLGATAVGGFAPIGAAGSGQSMVGDGGSLQVRGDSGMAWGRYDTDLSIGGHWLDSNDNTGIAWRIEGLGRFDALAFFVLDAADVGGRFSIRVGETLFADLAGADGRLANGNILFVRILLDAAVDSLTVELMHDRANDGFGIDGAMIAQVASTPVPPAALLLGTGLALAAGLRRRRRPAPGASNNR
jgi:MYXO-CTERM domain-containing protein